MTAPDSQPASQYPSPWTIAATVDRVQLDPAGRAETTFTVTNNGPVDQRLVLDVVSSDDTGPVRFTVAEPQRLVPHGGSVSFLVKIEAPPGTPAGARWLAGRVYSADAAPEESSVLSDRVAFEVKPTEAPVPWWRKWWWLIVVAALVLVVLVVVLVLVLGDDEPPPPPPGPPVHKSGQVVVPDDGPFDLDELVAAERGGGADDVELFGAAIEAERFFQSSGDALMTKIGPTADARQACLDAQKTNFGVNIAEINVGEIFCVQTSEGRLSVAEVKGKVSGRNSSLTLAVTTFE